MLALLPVDDRLLTAVLVKTDRDMRHPAHDARAYVLDQQLTQRRWLELTVGRTDICEPDARLCVGVIALAQRAEDAQRKWLAGLLNDIDQPLRRHSYSRRAKYDTRDG